MIEHADKIEWIGDNEKNGNRKNRNFVQLYKENLAYCRTVLKKDSNAFALFLFLIEHMDNKNALVCSMQMLCDYFEVSRQTMSKRVKKLIEHGFIDVLKLGTSNVYIINPDIAWSSWNNGKVYCKFESNVMIALSEQEKRLYVLEMEKHKQIKIQATRTPQEK